MACPEGTALHTKVSSRMPNPDAHSKHVVAFNGMTQLGIDGLQLPFCKKNPAAQAMQLFVSLHFLHPLTVPTKLHALLSAEVL